MYNVGDTVRIRETPPENRYDAWVFFAEDMDQYCNRTAIIVDKHIHDRGSMYHLDIDDGLFAWCDECFVSDYVEESPDVEIDAADLFTMLKV